MLTPSLHSNCSSGLQGFAMQTRCQLPGLQMRGSHYPLEWFSIYRCAYQKKDVVVRPTYGRSHRIVPRSRHCGIILAVQLLVFKTEILTGDCTPLKRLQYPRSFSYHRSRTRSPWSWSPPCNSAFPDGETRLFKMNGKYSRRFRRSEQHHRTRRRIEATAF
ncbi:hypothetical protein C8R45DRAFT_962755, partial [Mycena sanguinolenta]